MRISDKIIFLFSYLFITYNLTKFISKKLASEHAREALLFFG